MSKRKTIFNIVWSVLLFLIITNWIRVIMLGEMPLVDQWTRGFVDTVAESNIHTICRWITELGSDTFLIPFTIVMGILLWWLYRDWLPSLLFVGGTLGSHLFNMLLKSIVTRERPHIWIEANAEGYSFPSGHAMIPMVCYGLLMYFLIKKVVSKKVGLGIQISLSLLIFLIGMSRYVINVHYLTDVLTGFIIGYIILISCIHLFETLNKRRFNGSV